MDTNQGGSIFHADQQSAHIGTCLLGTGGQHWRFPDQRTKCHAFTSVQPVPVDH